MQPRTLEPQAWLRPLSWLYGMAIATRNAGFALGLRRVTRLPIPVVSVGNLSVGGTGKTPFIIHLIERMHDAGLRVGVLARGYGRRPGAEFNDEGMLLRRRFPQLPQVQDASRAKAGQRLLAAQDVDLLLLDDGFQHRMLHRDLDLCLLDALRPFGGGLLPAGYAREPKSGLRRADLCILTASDALTAEELAALSASIERRTRGQSCFAMRAVVRDLVEWPGAIVREKSMLAGRDVVALAGIARPERFVASLEAQGARVLARRFVRDHAQISEAVLGAASAEARKLNALLVTTEKDEARLELDAQLGPQRFVLRIDLQFDERLRPAPPLAAFLPEALQQRVHDS